MKYLVAVDDCFLDRPGGAARVAWDIAQLIHDNGHDVTMVSLFSGESAVSHSLETHEGIRILRIKKPGLPRWHPRRFFAGMETITQAVRATLADEPWDILHIHSPQTGLGTHRALSPKTRVVTTIHSPIVMEYLASTATTGAVSRVKSWLSLPLLKRMERRLLQSSDSIHTLSQFTRVNLHFFHGVGDRVTIIPHWKRPDLQRSLSKAEARRQLGWPEHDKLFFTVRHHGPRNGIDLSLRAIAPLIHQGLCKYYLAGDGPLRSYHEELAKDLGLKKHVHFMGRISDEELALAYQATDAFLLPTRALECFGLIILEALAYGCPVLSSNAGAIPELMQPILPDLIFPAGDAEAMHSKLEEFLSSSLPIPTSQELVDYVSLRYGYNTITPQLLKWIGLTP